MRTVLSDRGDDGISSSSFHVLDGCDSELVVSAKSAWGLREIFSTRVAYSYTYSGLRVSFSCLISLISLIGLCAFREKLFSESRLGKSAESVNKARKGISQIPDACDVSLYR